MPITYKDHPLAFLQSRRITPESLASRATDWRDKGYLDHGLNVAASIDEAVRIVVDRRAGMEAIADLVEAGAEKETIEAAVAELPEDDTASKRLWSVAEGLRVGNRDPYGGSVASHIEMAVDEIRMLTVAAAELRDHVENGADDRVLLETAAGAIDRVLTQPTHDAPVMTM